MYVCGARQITRAAQRMWPNKIVLRYHASNKSKACGILDLMVSDARVHAHLQLRSRILHHNF